MSPFHVLLVLFFFAALVPGWFAYSRNRQVRSGTGFFVGMAIGLLIAWLITLILGWMIGL